MIFDECHQREALERMRTIQLDIKRERQVGRLGGSGKWKVCIVLLVFEILVNGTPPSAVTSNIHWYLTHYPQRPHWWPKIHSWQVIHDSYIWPSNGWDAQVQILHGLPVRILNLSLCRIIKDKWGASQEAHQGTLHPERLWKPREHQCHLETYCNWYSIITWWVRRWEESHFQVSLHIWIRIFVGTFTSGCQKGNARQDAI